MELLIIPIIICVLVWLVVTLKRGHASSSRPAPILTGRKSKGRGIGTSIAGTSHDNDDGSNRTKIIVSKCRKGEALALVREPHNPYDLNAVAIYRFSGDALAEQLGFLHKEDAARIGPAIDAGRIFGAKITSLHGAVNPKSDNPYAGVNISIQEYQP